MRKPPGREILSVTEISDRIVRLLEKNFGDVWIKGEVSVFVKHSSGHWYFSLKDENSVIRAVMFRNRNACLRYTPENGAEVLVRGRVSAYGPRSAYQIIAEWIEPAGVGALHLRFEKLKERLEKEGLFDPERKRTLPSPLRRIAIITSISGAALQDMLRVLGDRDPGIEVLLIPAPVQGEGAADKLARAVRTANRASVARQPGRRPVEALIIGRGGGSLEDLWAFNQEVLARAIYESELPVISAVGHETDFTMADFTADVRAATPTAAAQMVSAGRAERIQRVDYVRRRLKAEMQKRLDNAARELGHASAMMRDPLRVVMDRIMRVDELDARAGRAVTGAIRTEQRRLAADARALYMQDPRTVHRRQRERLYHAGARLAAGAWSRLQRAETRMAAAAAGLEALSPAATLQRGFSIALDSKGAVIREARKVSVGEEIELVLHKGRLEAETTKVTPEE